MNSRAPHIVIRPDTAHRRRRDRWWYVLGDWLAAWVAWTAFFVIRSAGESARLDWSRVWSDRNYLIGAICLPLAWVVFYALFDQYRDIYRLSRFRTLAHTFLLSAVGSIFLFFVVLIDDQVISYQAYYGSLLRLFGLHFSLTAVQRMVQLTRASRRLKSGIVSFNTLIVGGSDRAVELFQQIRDKEGQAGHRFVGFVDRVRGSRPRLARYLPGLGDLSQLRQVIEEERIEEVIIAIETSQHDMLKSILDQLYEFGDRVLVKIIPDMYDIMAGSVRMNHIFGEALIEVRQHRMAPWQQVIKRSMDVVASAVMLILLAPLYAYIAYRVRRSSSGPIIYRQERIGRGGEPFTILKFRSMYTDAEAAGPALSSDTDNRCTPWGGIMRKWRLDELPQFWNVLRGDMSLVGPRPERQHYIDLIMERAPHYRHLLKVRPGITSWGQVKYGYASNVDQMIQRLKYDVLYIENQSLALDFKIMFYTIVVLLQGKGK